MKKKKEKCNSPNCCVRPGSVQNPAVYNHNHNRETEWDLLHKRNSLEKWFDKYNHIMEFVRTIFALTTIVLQIYIISRLV
jgi:hypothetical protein